MIINQLDYIHRLWHMQIYSRGDIDISRGAVCYQNTALRDYTLGDYTLFDYTLSEYTLNDYTLSDYTLRDEYRPVEGHIVFADALSQHDILTGGDRRSGISELYQS